jgi:predicted nucleic acid-binding Zn ribbon protein
MRRESRFIPPMFVPKPSPRDQVLAEWRRVHLESEEKARAVTAKPVGEILPRVMKELRLEQRQAETEVLRAWNALLDPNVTAHAQPVGLHKGTLFVNVDSSVWLDDIVRYRQREIMDRLRHTFGLELVKRISFRLG